MMYDHGDELWSNWIFFFHKSKFPIIFCTENFALREHANDLDKGKQDEKGQGPGFQLQVHIGNRHKNGSLLMVDSLIKK